MLDVRGSRRVSGAGGRCGPWLRGAGWVLLGRWYREPQAGCGRTETTSGRAVQTVTARKDSRRGQRHRRGRGRSRVKGRVQGAGVEATVRRRGSLAQGQAVVCLSVSFKDTLSLM